MILCVKRDEKRNRLALKIAKGIAIAGQVLSVVGVALSVFMQIKSDIDEDNMREDLRNNRQNIRSQFNTAANELEEQGKVFIKEIGSKMMEVGI